jgi:hypothetical protein
MITIPNKPNPARFISPVGKTRVKAARVKKILSLMVNFSIIQPMITAARQVKPIMEVAAVARKRLGKNSGKVQVTWGIQAMECMRFPPWIWLCGI